MRARSSITEVLIRNADAPLRRELYFYTLYRVFQAALFTLVVFSPFTSDLASLRHPILAKGVAVAFLVASLVMLVAGRHPAFGLRRQAAVGLALDIAVAMLAMHTLRGLETSVGLLLVVNIGAGALLLSLRAGLSFAGLAVLGVVAEYLVTRLVHDSTDRSLPEVVMFTVTYLATAVFCHLLGRQMREAQALADQRGAEVANLAQLNELIIRRMRTGVLVVDAANRIQLINEAGWFLLGGPRPGEQPLLDGLAPELSRRLFRWRNEHETDGSAIQLAEDTPEVIPRFARLTVTDDLFLIFLDDTSLVSRRAEQLTLATLGRLSASIAHEIRNPLAAISYSAQLLDESPDLTDTDRRLVEIIRNHGERMNGIVEDILNLARRERSRPEPLDLAPWVYEFADEFRAAHYMEGDEIKAVCASRHVFAMVDPHHLHQVVTNLVLNALKYGRMPGEPARITVVARQTGENTPALVEVIDRGPGIPERVAATIFDPFFTTSEHGTGLGLYLARQICEANQATLDYVPVAGGGSCFRISLSRPRGVPLPTAPRAAEEPGTA